MRAAVKCVTWVGRTALLLEAWTLVLLMQASVCSLLQPPTFTPSDMEIFQDKLGGVTKYYRYIIISGSGSSASLYVGAMEYVYKLSATNISSRIGSAYAKSAQLKADFNDEINCRNRGKSVNFDCKNHIRAIIIKDKGDIDVCGTGAYNPRLYMLNSILGKLGESTQRSGTGKCPFDPNDNATCIYIKSGNPGGVETTYAGTVTDISKSDSLIARPALSRGGVQYSEALRTLFKNSKWLNEAQFVGSMDVGQYVFFFFRETAVEYSNYGKAVYSRVARVCKNDKGTNSGSTGTWTTFLKARLNCSIAGEFPFYFNEIHDVLQIGDTFIGVFTSSLTGLYGSAVCSFKRKSITDMFDIGNFIGTNWLPVPPSQVPIPRPGQCKPDSHSLSERAINFIKVHPPLMDKTVEPDGGGPLFYQHNIVFQRLVADTVDYGRKQYTVLFLGTNYGHVHKVASWRDNSGQFKFNTLAIWKPFGNKVVTIWTMKIHIHEPRTPSNHNKSLYLGTDSQVVQIKVTQCSSYVSCTMCVRDPYCGWNKAKGKCATYIARPANELIQNVEQDGTTTCKQNRACSYALQHRTLRLQGDPLHMDCRSHCIPHSAVKWFHERKSIEVDNQSKYFVTQENGLVILNTTDTDGGKYECKSGDAVLAQYQVIVPKCDMKCTWQREFKNWCQEFDNYKKEFNRWVCLKNKCLNNNNCVPNDVSCDRP